ncbi:MAG TPA: IS200/IS605 family transposase [Thermodesulfovibrionales bacterium]|nr:IS200/IS605 family transposase [Thermodesulfovibrionales bacterium]
MAAQSEASGSWGSGGIFWHNLAMAEYWTGAQTKHRLQVHLVWIPRYRKRVLRGKIAIRWRQRVREACKMNQWQISEMSLQTDHIHLIMQIKPNDSISGIAQTLKGGTSRALRKEFPELDEFLWGDSFWADGYFAESVGHVDADILKRYIREQQGRA